LFRLEGVSAFLALMTVFRLTITGYIAPPLGLFTAYWVAAVAVWWASTRSDRFARFTGLSIPLVDMPVVFLVLRGAIAALRVGGRHTDTLPYHAPLYYVALIFLASLALENRQVYFAGAVAVGCVVLLTREGGLDITLLLLSVLATGLMTSSAPSPARVPSASSAALRANICAANAWAATSPPRSRRISRNGQTPTPRAR